MDSCSSCKHFKPEDGALPSDARPSGLCRRYPPQLYITQQVSQVQPQQVVAGLAKQSPPYMLITAAGLMASFPTMDAATGWCGEWTSQPPVLQ